MSARGADQPLELVQSPRRTAEGTGVVLLNWNSADLTLECIASLLDGDLVPAAIVVVDNGSQDDSPDVIALAAPQVILLRNRQNLGFAEGNNVGLRYLIERGYEWLWVLNNDTVVEPYCLRVLLEAATDHQEAVAVGATIYYHAKPDRLWYGGGVVSRWTMRAKHVVTPPQDDVTREVDFVTGCSMFLHAPRIQCVGLFDRRYFAYAEDLELSLRIREAGGRLLYAPRAVMYHKVSAVVHRMTLGDSRGSATAFQYFHIVRNRLYVIRQHASSFLPRAVGFASVFWEFAPLAVGQLLLGRSEKALAIARGLYHGAVDQL